MIPNKYIVTARSMNSSHGKYSQFDYGLIDYPTK